MVIAGHSCSGCIFRLDRIKLGTDAMRMNRAGILPFGEKKMDEQSLCTHIGSEIFVSVYFDYQPEEKPETNYPGCDSEVIINAVYGNGSEHQDILEVLNDDCFNALKIECEQMLTDQERENYLSDQEER